MVKKTGKQVKPDLIVVFRKFKGTGEIIAFFPQVPGNASGSLCQSYVHVGQHGAADYPLESQTVLAKPAEYKSLLKELKSIGYGKDENLVIRQKYSPKYDKWRKYWRGF